MSRQSRVKDGDGDEDNKVDDSSSSGSSFDESSSTSSSWSSSSSSSSSSPSPSDTFRLPPLNQFFLRKRRTFSNPSTFTFTSTSTTATSSSSSPSPVDLEGEDRDKKGRIVANPRRHLYHRLQSGSKWWFRQASTCGFVVALCLWCLVHVRVDPHPTPLRHAPSPREEAVVEVPAVAAAAAAVIQRPPPFRQPPRRSSPPRIHNNFWHRTMEDLDEPDLEMDEFEPKINRTQNHRPKKTRGMEDMPEGCSFCFKWQTMSFPNCNVLHEVDLRQHLKLVKGTHSHVPSDTTTTAAAPSEYFVADGLWRDVFSIRPNEQSPSVVAKLMKPEHEVVLRNLDRHRRDALAMERLTSSPNVVDIYGYCGNTVVIEQAATDLSSYLKQLNNHKRHHNNKAGSNVTSSFTVDDQLRMTLEVARGMAALHSQDIIHADVQTKQFLVDYPQGTIKLNDFNRCRFLPRKRVDNSTTTAVSSYNDNNNNNNNSTSTSTSTHNNGEYVLPICPIRIPSAPGLWRSPEEYTGKPLIQAMDMYSLGNVLHEILMGEKPFAGMGAKQLKRNVCNGVHPEIELQGDAATDPRAHRLVALIQLCLEHDVERRIGAADLVQELERLVAQPISSADMTTNEKATRR